MGSSADEAAQGETGDRVRAGRSTVFGGRVPPYISMVSGLDLSVGPSPRSRWRSSSESKGPSSRWAIARRASPGAADRREATPRANDRLAADGASSICGPSAPGAARRARHAPVDRRRPRHGGLRPLRIRPAAAAAARLVPFGVPSRGPAARVASGSAMRDALSLLRPLRCVGAALPVPRARLHDLLHRLRTVYGGRECALAAHSGGVEPRWPRS